MLNNEECWVLKGKAGRWFWKGRYDRYTVGVPAQVAFDPDYVWDNRDKIVGWIHTHPQWTADPSGTDDATMKAQVCALGRPLLCCIDGTDGLRAYWYMDDESDPVEVRVWQYRRGVYGRSPSVHKKIRSRRVLQG